MELLDPPSSARLLDRVAAGVRSLTSVDDAVALMATELQAPFELSRVGVRLLRPGTDELIIVATWSAMPTRLVPGSFMRTRQTSYPDVLRARKTVVGRPTPGGPLSGEVVASEGARIWAAIPLPDAAHVQGLLTLCSFNEDFPVTDDYFDALNARIGRHMLDLGRASHWNGSRRPTTP